MVFETQNGIFQNIYLQQQFQFLQSLLFPMRDFECYKLHFFFIGQVICFQIKVETLKYLLMFFTSVVVYLKQINVPALNLIE